MRAYRLAVQGADYIGLGLAGLTQQSGAENFRLDVIVFGCRQHHRAVIEHQLQRPIFIGR